LAAGPTTPTKEEAVAVIPVIPRQNKIVAAFRAADATSRDRATTSAALAIEEGMAFRNLCRQEVLRAAGEQRFYLDQPTWEALESRRRRLAIALSSAAVVIVVAGVVWALTR
jgi:hypothetical protein